MVAPMNSDGEKIPPEAPEPRLIEVAASLAANSSDQQRRQARPPVQDRLDGRIADALDVVLPGGAQQRVDHHADDQHADDVAQIGLCDALEYVLGKAQAADEGRSRRARSVRRATRKAAATRATPALATPSSAVGMAKAGWMPKKIRPMKVAVPVASATGRKVRALTSGIISSMANITPPIGVLKVAAMPAPAPAATSVMRCHGAMRMIWPRVEPSDEPIWMIGPSRPTAAPVPIDKRRGERFDHRDDRPDHAFLVVDRVHHLGHAVAARFRREIGDQEGDDQAADHRHQNDEGAPRARRREHVGVVVDRELAEESDVVDQADQGAEHDGAEAGDDADDNRQQRQPQQPEPQGQSEFHAISTRGRARFRAAGSSRNPNGSVRSDFHRRASWCR